MVKYNSTTFVDKSMVDTAVEKHTLLRDDECILLKGLTVYDRRPEIAASLAHIHEGARLGADQRARGLPERQRGKRSLS